MGDGHTTTRDHTLPLTPPEQHSDSHHHQNVSGKLGAEAGSIGSGRRRKSSRRTPGDGAEKLSDTPPAPFTTHAAVSNKSAAIAAPTCERTSGDDTANLGQVSLLLLGTPAGHAQQQQQQRYNEGCSAAPAEQQHDHEQHDDVILQLTSAPDMPRATVHAPAAGTATTSSKQRLPTSAVMNIPRPSSSTSHPTLDMAAVAKARSSHPGSSSGLSEGAGAGTRRNRGMTHRRARSALPQCPPSPFAAPQVQRQVVPPEPVKVEQLASLKGAKLPSPAAPPAAHPPRNPQHTTINNASANAATHTNVKAGQQAAHWQFPQDPYATAKPWAHALLPAGRGGMVMGTPVHAVGVGVGVGVGGNANSNVNGVYRAPPLSALWYTHTPDATNPATNNKINSLAPAGVGVSGNGAAMAGALWGADGHPDKAGATKARTSANGGGLAGARPPHLKWMESGELVKAMAAADGSSQSLGSQGGEGGRRTGRGWWRALLCGCGKV